jgi:hypothetical protein
MPEAKIKISAFKYADRTTPEGYSCHECGKSGIRLYRDYNTFLDHLDLLCTACLSSRKDVHVDYAQPCHLGDMVPAIPTEEGDTFWGFTSVPAAGCLWWYNLHIFPYAKYNPDCPKCGGSGIVHGRVGDPPDECGCGIDYHGRTDIGVAQTMTWAATRNICDLESDHDVRVEKLDAAYADIMASLLRLALMTTNSHVPSQERLLEVIKVLQPRPGMHQDDKDDNGLVIHHMSNHSEYVEKSIKEFLLAELSHDLPRKLEDEIKEILTIR